MTKIVAVPTEYLKNLPEVDLTGPVIDVSGDKKDYFVPKHSNHINAYKDEVVVAQNWFNNEMELLINNFLKKFPEYYVNYKKHGLIITLYDHGEHTKDNIKYHEFGLDGCFKGSFYINTRSQDTPEDHFYKKNKEDTALKDPECIT